MTGQQAPSRGDVPDRLIRATITLLVAQGPAAIKARTVAAEVGLSTQAVYHHFGGIPELTNAVISRGFSDLERAFSRVPVTDDPIAELLAVGLLCREFGHANPHLYDLMFGLSNRATYRPPTASPPSSLSGQSAEFRSAFAHITRRSARLIASGRAKRANPAAMAKQLFALLHGFVGLELADHYAEFDDPVMEILCPLAVNFFVGLGDRRAAAQSSCDLGLQMFAGFRSAVS